MKKLNNSLVLAACFAAIVSLCSCSYESNFDIEEVRAECTANNIALYNDNPYIVLEPQNPKAGFVFYPGGLVSYESYLPLLVKCAKNDIACFIIQMPSDFAILDMNAASRLFYRYTNVTNWYIGGHSLGGAMASSYIASNNDKFKGLILLAAYSTSDLTTKNIKAISIYGSKDGVLNMEKYNKYKSNLPSDFKEVVIDGGNHGNFGTYGDQKGDNPSTITREVQQQTTADEIKIWMGL